MSTSGVRELVERLLAGEARALARAISWIEDEDERGFEVLDAVYPRVGGSYRIGISGPPGAGKSTLVDGLTEHYLDAGKTVGIIAVDPTSPFTGGALLGDRIRLREVRDDVGGIGLRAVPPGGSSRLGQDVDADDLADADAAQELGDDPVAGTEIEDTQVGRIGIALEQLLAKQAGDVVRRVAA